MKRWKHLYSIDGQFECYYCHRILPIDQATRDHKKSEARFKDNSPENIVPSCQACNSKKGMLTPEEYKLWQLLDKVRNGDKDKDLIANLELVMMILESKHYRGKYL